MRLYGLYIKVLLAVWLVLAVVVVLQLTMNSVKIKSLVAETVASRVDVLAGAVADRVERAERLGLRPAEIETLDALLRRAVDRDDDIAAMHVLSAVGDPVASFPDRPFAAAEAALAIRRLQTGSEPRSLHDDGRMIHVGRALTDSAGEPLGYVVTSFGHAVIEADVAVARSRLRRASLLILAVSAALVAPFVVVGFSGARALVRTLLSADLERDEPVDGRLAPEVPSELLGEIAAGNRAVRRVREELAALRSQA